LNDKTKLLITDMDGTLLDSKQQVSAENLVSIKRFVEEGGLFTIATGRMTKTVFPYLPILPINAPAILFNGTVIYDFKKNEILWEKHLAGDESMNLLGRLREEFPELGIEIFHGDEIYLLNENEETVNHFCREKIIPVKTNLENIPFPCYKILVAWDPGKLLQVEEFLKSAGPSLRYTYSEPQFLEILDAGCSKGNALKELIKILDISKENVVALGDNLNDIELIREAGTGIAVENAHPELKKNADMLTTGNDDHAVSSVLKMLKLITGSIFL
jgi:Cof subfamily protein (haloacid dehalogenase superfamily)